MTERGSYDEEFWRKIPLYNGHTGGLNDAGVYKLEGDETHPRRLVITYFYPAFIDAAISTNIHAWFVFASAHGLCRSEKDFRIKLAEMECSTSSRNILDYMKGEKGAWNGNLTHQFSKPVSVLAFAKSLACAISQLTGQIVGMGDILGLPPADTDKAVLASCLKKLGCDRADINTEKLLNRCRDKEMELAKKIFSASLETERKRLSQSEFVNYVKSLVSHFEKNLPGESLSNEESRFFKNARDDAAEKVFSDRQKERLMEKQPVEEWLDCLLARYLTGSESRISYEKANHLFRQITELVRETGLSFLDESHMADSDFHAYGYEKKDGRWTFSGKLGQGILHKIKDNWKLWALLHGSAAVFSKTDPLPNEIAEYCDFWDQILSKNRLDWRETGQESSLQWAYEPGLEEWMNHMAEESTISAIWEHADSEADLQDIFHRQKLFLKDILENDKNRGKQFWNQLEESYKGLWTALVKLVRQERMIVRGEANFRLDMEKRYPDAIPFLLDDSRSWEKAEEKWEGLFAGIPGCQRFLTDKSEANLWEGKESALRQAADFILRKEDVSYWWKQKAADLKVQRERLPLDFSAKLELFWAAANIGIDTCPVSLSFPEKVKKMSINKGQESHEKMMPDREFMEKLFDYYRAPLKPYTFTGLEKKEWMLVKILFFCLDKESIKTYIGNFSPKARDSRNMDDWIKKVCDRAHKEKTDTYTIELQGKDRDIEQVNSWAEASLPGRIRGFHRDQYYSYLAEMDGEISTHFDVSLMTGECLSFGECGSVPWYHQFPEIKEVVFKADRLFFIREKQQGDRELIVWEDKNGDLSVTVYRGQEDGDEEKWAVPATGNDEIPGSSGIQMDFRHPSFYFSLGIPLCSWIGKEGEKEQLVLLHSHSYDLAIWPSREKLSWKRSHGRIDAYTEEIRKKGIPVRFTQVFGSLGRVKEIYAYAENPRLEIHLNRDYCGLDL